MWLIFILLSWGTSFYKEDEPKYIINKVSCAWCTLTHDSSEDSQMYSFPKRTGYLAFLRTTSIVMGRTAAHNTTRRYPSILQEEMNSNLANSSELGLKTGRLCSWSLSPGNSKINAYIGNYFFVHTKVISQNTKIHQNYFKNAYDFINSQVLHKNLKCPLHVSTLKNTK